MNTLEFKSESNSIGIDIDKVAVLYGNRRTVVQAFLKDKCNSPELLTNTELSVFEVIELQLGYPIPAKIRDAVS